MEIPDTFELQHKENRIKVQRHSVANEIIYRILFPDNTPPLVLTRASDSNADRFWTSIPEGRQKEAEEIGPLIAEYIKTHL